MPLNGCSPNGATVGPGSNLLLGCTPGNNPTDTTTLVINAINKNYSHIAGITAPTKSGSILVTSAITPAPAPIG